LKMFHSVSSAIRPRHLRLLRSPCAFRGKFADG
jgi:hypothetical protein